MPGAGLVKMLEKLPAKSTESLFKSFPLQIASGNELVRGSGAIRGFYRSQRHRLTGSKGSHGNQKSLQEAGWVLLSASHLPITLPAAGIE